MIIVIDGYNLLKSIMPSEDITDYGRRQFLSTLGRYARRKNHTLVVMFDGGSAEWPSVQKMFGMKVIYSGYRESADELIMHYINDYHTKDLLVVSSDHEINLYASDHDVPSIGSEDFYYLVQQAVAVSTSADEEEIHILDDLDDAQDLDALMEQASKIVPHKAEDTLPSHMRERALRASKRDRKLMEKLKKL